MTDVGYLSADDEARAMFANALGSVRAVIKRHEADTGKYTYKYADLNDVMEECTRACLEFGLVFTQIPTVIDDYLAVILRMFHINGGVVSFEPLMMTLPKEAQAYGSALTYSKRYQLTSVFRMPTEDDDGRAATVAAQAQPGRRTEAERLIRESIATMSEAERKEFTADFKQEFNSTLTDLPATRHGQALTWTREWRPHGDQHPAAREDAADAAWVDAARNTPEGIER